MRHSKLNKRFGRNKSARRELIRSLARNTLIYSKIKTTLPKAKEASKLVDKLITLGKQQTLQSKRAAYDLLQDRTLVAKLVNDVAPLFKERNGGYTRIVRLSNRHGDGAELAVLELIEKPQKKPKQKVKPDKPTKAVKKQEVIQAAQEKPKAVDAEPKEEKQKQQKPKAKKETPAPQKTEQEEKHPKKLKPEQPADEKVKKGWFTKIKGVFKKEKP